MYIRMGGPPPALEVFPAHKATIHIEIGEGDGAELFEVKVKDLQGEEVGDISV